jgi:hypothetical protein
MTFKQKTYRVCVDILQQKTEELRSALNTISESANNETKSSAGDKHETSRAMMQLEQEKLGKQLKELQDQKNEFEKIDIRNAHSIIAKGSLVKTDKGFLFIAIGLGKIVVDQDPVIAISHRSPLAQELIGLKVGQNAKVNGIQYSIEEIL